MHKFVFTYIVCRGVTVCSGAYERDVGVRQCKTNYEKPPLFPSVDQLYVTYGPPLWLNLTGFQPGLDWFSNVKLRSHKQKKGEVKAYSPELLILPELSRFWRYEVDITGCGQE